jgi:hypothetical protein
MLQIDDAGWGCLVGGVTIGCYRVETAEFVAGTVAPAFFQDDDPDEPGHFRYKDYLGAAAHVVEVCLTQLKATPAEPVVICSGYVLDGVRARLTTQGYRWQTAKITGPLQELVECAFQAYLAGLGFSVSCDLLTDHKKAGLFWWRQIQWLKGGDVNATMPDSARAAVCKTGWSTYLTWASHSYAEARALAGRGKRRQTYTHN